MYHLWLVFYLFLLSRKCLSNICCLSSSMKLGPSINFIELHYHHIMPLSKRFGFCEWQLNCIELLKRKISKAQSSCVYQKLVTWYNTIHVPFVTGILLCFCSAEICEAVFSASAVLWNWALVTSWKNVRWYTYSVCNWFPISFAKYSFSA